LLLLVLILVVELISRSLLMPSPTGTPADKVPPKGNILLIRLKSIGDIIFTLPAVHVVRENFPRARISFLVSKEHEPLISGFKDVDEVIGLDRALYHRKNPKDVITESFSLLRLLRRKKFALSVDFQGYGETALLTRLTGAPQRWGTAKRRSRSWAYTHGVRRTRRLHPIERNVALLVQNGMHRGTIRNEFVLPEPALGQARRFYATHKLLVSRPTLFIQPFTSVQDKNWPLENYLALARHWQSRGIQILFGGGPKESTALESVRGAGFPVSAGVPLLTNAGLMKLSTVVVGGDTGLLHLAIAMNKRVEMLMASAAPGKPHPFPHADWAVTPADGRKISGIETARVIESCRRALVESGAKIPAA
jgi:ADP-heptose:LPS heptosyltransferase